MERVFALISNKIKEYSRYLMVVVFLILLVSLVRSIFKIVDSGKKIDEAKMKVIELENEHQELLSQLKVVESDKYIESQIRDKLGFVKEREIIVVLPDDEVLRSLAPRDIEEEAYLPPPNWKKWLNLFF